MDTATGRTCQCCGAIKSEEEETIPTKSELVEIKKEIDEDVKPNVKPNVEMKTESKAETTQNIDSGDIENEANISLNEKMKTEESNTDTKSWKLIAERAECSVKQEENEDKKNLVCNSCGGIVLQREKDPDTKLMIPLLGTVHITTTSADFDPEPGKDKIEIYVNRSFLQDPDNAIRDTFDVAVDEVTQVMQDQVEPIVIQPVNMEDDMVDNERQQEKPDRQPYTTYVGDAIDAENNSETFKSSIICAGTGGMKAKDAAKTLTTSLVVQEP